MRRRVSRVPSSIWESFIEQDAIATVADGLAAFDEYLSRGKRLEAILITQNGRSSEALLGIITVHDIPKLNQAIHR